MPLDTLGHLPWLFGCEIGGEMNRMEELRDAIFYAVQEIIAETDDSDAIYAKTDSFMLKVDRLVEEAFCRATAPTWEHDGVTFHLTET
jgi:hypothetical protein